MTRTHLILVPAVALLALSGCAPTAAPSTDADSSAPVVAPVEERPWGDTPVEQFAVGAWQCDLSLDGAALPYGVSINVDEAGLYSVEVGGSGAFQNFRLTVADDEVLALGEAGEVDTEVGQTARVEGIPQELPADGESITISRFPEGATEADIVATLSREGDTVIVTNPTFGADEMSCTRG
ncbi:MAG: hypothetical protein RLZZ608_57 [Actinomycetota bacterium]|jgi:hypothetical protein